MAGDTVLTVIGNLTADPELRFTPSGAAVANLTVASTPRAFDKQTNEWKDLETAFWPCSVWREAAENVAESLQKGMKVIVVGRVKNRSWEDKNGGGKRSRMEIEIDSIGPDLDRATATVTRKSGGGGNSYGSGGGFGGGGQRGGGQARRGGVPSYGEAAPAADTWGGGSGQLNTDWGTSPEGGNAYSSEPPF